MRRVLVLALAGALVAAGCAETGNGASDDPTTSPTPTESPSPDESPSPGESPTTQTLTLAYIDRAFGQEDEDTSRLVVQDLSDETAPRPVAEGAIAEAEYSPSGDRIAFIARPDTDDGINERLVVADVDSGEVTELAVSNFSGLTWAPNGQRLASATSEPGEPDPTRISIIDVPTGEVTEVTEPADGADDFLPAWSPTGDTIAFVRARHETSTGNDTDSRQLRLLDVDEGTTTVLAEELFHEGEPTWEPDGDTVVFPATDVSAAEAPRTLHSVTPSAPDEDARAFGPSGVHGGAAFSPDGSALAVVIGDQPDASDLHVFHAATGEELAVLDGDAFDISPTWAPDNTTIAFIAATGLQGDADIAIGDITTGEVRMLTNDGSVEAPDFAPR